LIPASHEKFLNEATKANFYGIKSVSVRIKKNVYSLIFSEIGRWTCSAANKSLESPDDKFRDADRKRRHATSFFCSAELRPKARDEERNSATEAK